jgi:hypothetical protein
MQHTRGIALHIIYHIMYCMYDTYYVTCTVHTHLQYVLYTGVHTAVIHTLYCMCII